MIKIPFNKKLFDTHILKITKNIIENIKNTKNKFFLNQDSYQCLNYLTKNKIEEILKADSNNLKKIIEEFKIKFPNSVNKDSQIYKLLKDEIFEKEYNNWSSRKKYGAYYFVKELNLNTCPYCNRNYTFVVDSKNGKLRPEIDHFYPISIYPFLAVSFYNLIPSCQICNHTKGNKDTLSDKHKISNPYEIKEDEFKFTYTPTNINFNQIESKKYNFDNFEIEFKNANPANLEVFKLEELYRQHKDIVLELLIKKAYYPKSYIKELKDSFNFSEDEIYRFIIGNYKEDKDLHKRPLSKLIRDISQELKLI